MRVYRLSLGFFAAFLVAVFAVPNLWAQKRDGYSIVGNKVLINSKEDWEKWRFPVGALNIGNDGNIKPTFIRKNINAVADADNFVGKKGKGGATAGSNEKDAVNVTDGDPNTYWEPDFRTPLSTWWIEIDLGRLVSATKVVIRFVEEGKGDPFRQFRVLISDGDVAFSGGKLLKYTLLGKTTKPNETQRLFEYELTTTPVVGGYALSALGKKADLNWTGETIQFVMIQITDRKKGTQPRLTDVEVWSLGDNIALGTISRGGYINECGIGGAGKAADGDFITSWIAAAWTPFRPRGRGVIDLGTKFWVDSYRLISRYDPSATYYGTAAFYGYVIRGSDGLEALGGGEVYPCDPFPKSLVWQYISPAERQDNTAKWIQLVEDKFPPRKIRYLDIRNWDVTFRFAGSYGYYSLANEFQIYGEGYVPEVTLTSPLIELGEPENLTSIEWEADLQPATQIEIRTRTGDVVDTVKHYYNKSGAEVTESQYNKLASFQKGEIKEEKRPSSDWSTWSQVYLKSGDPIFSPSPRKYAMIQVKLKSDDPQAAILLKSISLNFTTPVAKQIIGEIIPSSVKAAVPQDFSLSLKPTFSSGDKGFDEILLTAPVGVKMDFLNVLSRDNEIRDVKVIRTGQDTLWVRLPRVLEIGTTDPVEVRFRAAIYLYGSLFKAFIENSSIPASWQRVDPARSGAMAISVPVTHKLIEDFYISPEVFTPNGDGINDVAIIKFAILKINVTRKISARMYNLGGILVKEVNAVGKKGISGSYEMTWDGTDESGNKVPPGIYLCQISIDADSGTETVRKVISVAY